MATFLALVQKVAREAGTLDSASITTVAGQTGMKGKMVGWVQDAWRSIQNAHSSWLWQQAEFYGNTVASTQRYAYTSFNDFATSATITRFADWIVDREGPDSGISLHDPAVGVADEGPLRYVGWDLFYKTQLRGTQTEDKPSMFTIAPDSKLVFSRTPDAVYTIRGRYRKDEQTLSADGDIPECPARFHDAIVDAALMLLGTHDEAAPQIPLWQMRKSRNFCDLERDQLPRVSFSASPLA
jgi:hypothetical protein